MKLHYSKLISVIAAIAIAGTLSLFPAEPAHAAQDPGTCEQANYAVFENDGGVPGTQIGSDSSQATVIEGSEIFVCIQLIFSDPQKKYYPGVNWRIWDGDWEDTLQIGADSGTDWECFNGDYADMYEGITAHFTGTTDMTSYLESSKQTIDGEAWKDVDVVEVWFALEAPTTTGRYGLEYTRSEGQGDPVGLDVPADTLTKEVDILVVPAPVPPTVSTQAASSIGDNGATLNGNITDIGSDDVTERGFDWGLTDSYGSSWTETPGPYSTGAYSRGISGLDSGTTYHFRAKAYNSYGWAYGSELTFDTLEIDISSPDIGIVILGTVTTSSTHETGLDALSFTNTGNCAVDVTIKGSDFTGGTGWTLSDDGNAGASIIGIRAGLEGGAYNIIVKKNATYETLKSDLAIGVTQKFGLKFFIPTSFEDGDTKKGSVTLTATEHV